MKYADFVSGIAFRYIQPEVDITMNRINELNTRFSPKEELINTIIPERENELREILYPVCHVPRMSTFAIAAMINTAIFQMPAEHVYINVGVWNGFTFLAGILNNPDKKCIGIDNFSQFGGPREAFLSRFNQCKSDNHFFYDMDYLDYFSNIHKEIIGFYLYDGAHDYESQLKSLEVAEPFFSDNCLILVDDTNEYDPKQATLDFIARSKNKYRIILDKTTSSNGHPTFWNGVMMIQRYI